MSRTVNKVILIGNAGSDAQSEEKHSGDVCAKFLLATNYTKPNPAPGTDSEGTDWHRCVCFHEKAEWALEYIKKGDRLYIEGRIVYGSFTRDGVTIPTVDILCKEIVLLSPRT